MKLRSKLALSVLGCCWTLAAVPVLAGFSASDVFLAMAGRQAGVHPSNWYTTMWIHNPGEEVATARVHFLRRNTSNLLPPWVDVLVAPGDTERIDNAVETLFHLEAFGALRVTCATQRLVVTSRTYSKSADDDDAASVGQDFAGVPASFAIGIKERTQVLGVHQIVPAADSEYRFNFGFVETTGHTVTVRVRAFDGNSAGQGSTEFQVREYSQRQVAFKDHFPGISTANTRLEVEVIAGAGKVIAYGSGIANGSQDPTTFEMTYPDALLAENGAPGVTSVAAGAGLAGGGGPGAVSLDVGAGAGINVTDDAVAVAAGGVTPVMLAPGTQAGQVLTTVPSGSSAPELAAAGLGVAWQSLPLLPPSGPAGGSLSGTYPNPSIAGGQAVKSLNGLMDHVTLAGGENTIITPAGNTLTIASVGDITGVTAGTGLTGGGTSGEVPLAMAVPIDLIGNHGGGIINGTHVGTGNTGSFGGEAAGVFGGSTSGYAVWGVSTTGRGVFGLSDLGSGVHGESRTSAVSGFNVDSATWGILGRPEAGVYGITSGGHGVSGTSSVGQGVYGYSHSNAGVFGESSTFDGVFGISHFPAAAGVSGHNDAGGWAGYFIGPVVVTGFLTKSGGGFRIDHPRDPERQYLSHSFVESPEMKNVYDGLVTLDDQGEAVVELPSYFDALNRDFRYQLTCIGGHAPVYIAEKIAGNRFRIAGGGAGLEVSWQVTGVRQDPWAEANRLVVEAPKPEREQGTYLHPSLYGAPDELGADWTRRQTAMRKPESRPVRPAGGAPVDKEPAPSSR